jgi:hypothetical protein
MKAAFKIIGIVILSVLATAGFYFYLSLPDVSGLKIKNPRSTALMVQRYREAKKIDHKFRIRQKSITSSESVSNGLILKRYRNCCAKRSGLQKTPAFINTTVWILLN